MAQNPQKTDFMAIIFLTTMLFTYFCSKHFWVNFTQKRLKALLGKFGLGESLSYFLRFETSICISLMSTE